MKELGARNITKYSARESHRLQALGGINLKAESGCLVCLVEPSGCGKSTFLCIVAGLEQPDGGQILFDGRPVTETGPSRIMILQEDALFLWLKVGDNVEFGLKVAGISPQGRVETSKRYPDMMQLTKFADSYVYQLSAGMKQLVAITRALVMDPDVLLMDEPFAALDAQTMDLLFIETQLMWARTKTILFVTHNVAEYAILGTWLSCSATGPLIKWDLANNFPRIRTFKDNAILPFQHEILGGAWA